MRVSTTPCVTVPAQVLRRGETETVMIHTFEISYGLSLKDANTCANRLKERTGQNKGLTEKFLNVKKEKGYLAFKITDPPGIRAISLTKYKNREGFVCFRIKFIIEAEVLRTGEYTLDLFFASPEHAWELQSQYARAIYNLFPEAFSGRPALDLYTSGYAPTGSYTEEEYEHSGLYALPYLPLASVKRLDFTFDVEFDSSRDATLFTYMVMQSYYDGQKREEKKGTNKNKNSRNKCYDKEYKNGSRGFSAYYKYDKMFDEEYADWPNIAQIREEARNVVRIELPNFNLDRETVKSRTWLQIPEDGIPLGPLPYLANEQVAFRAFFYEYADHIGNAPGLAWYDRKELSKQLSALVRQHRINPDAKRKMVKISQAIAQGRSKQLSYPLKKAIDAFKKDGAIILHKQRNKNKEQVLERFSCSYAVYSRHRRQALDNGVLLVTIPDSWKVKSFPAIAPLRNYDTKLVAMQKQTHMLPYRSITGTVPEMEPVKDLYDGILGFLYGLYDQYSEPWNRKIEEVRLSPEEAGLIEQ